MNATLQKSLVLLVSAILLVAAGRMSAPTRVPKAVRAELAQERARADSLADALRAQLEEAGARSAEVERQTTAAIQEAQARGQAANDRARAAEARARALARQSADTPEGAQAADAAIDSLIVAQADELLAAQEETRQVRAQLFAVTAELEVARRALDARDASQAQASLAAAVAGSETRAGWRKKVDTGIKVVGLVSLGYFAGKVL